MPSNEPEPAERTQRTGDGAAEIALGYPPGHYYTPIVDPSESSVRRAMQEEAAPSVSAQSLGLDEQEMLRWFEIIAGQYHDERFPTHPEAGKLYHYDNPNFPLMDAFALLGFMQQFQPRRYIEVGAGSSCAAIDIAEQYLNGPVRFSFLDPYPETVWKLLEAKPAYRDSIVPVRLQDAPIEMFPELSAGDILFVDSSHVVKTGSDVLDCFFRILPALRSGVLIHLHDIFFPFEYPQPWIEQEHRSWNEAYLLRAFLCGNLSFRVLFFSDWIYKCKRELLAARMPLCVAYRGGSLWIQKQ